MSKRLFNKWVVLLKFEEDHIDPDFDEMLSIIDTEVKPSLDPNSKLDIDEEMDLEEEELLSEIEISVTHRDKDHTSYGWHDRDKIILTPDGLEDKEDLKYWLKIASLLRDALNTNKIK